MTERIQRKIYYRIMFRLVSPLSIGSGDNRYTDKDVIRDSSGEPYIPATAFAGLLRHQAEQNPELSREFRTYFGDVELPGAENGGKGRPSESRLIFCDAKMLPESRARYRTSVRDSVALDGKKSAKKGAKFDMEILEPGIFFHTYLEQSSREGDRDYAELLVRRLLADGIAFGGKTTRGYGAIQIEEVQTAEFDLSKEAGADAWIRFDLRQDAGWSPLRGETEGAGRQRNALWLSLRQRGGISIRKYTTELSADRAAQPDYSQLTVTGYDEQGKAVPIPVIPGTSWAGAIRHRARELGLGAESEERLFGIVRAEKNANQKKTKSALRFGESQIQGAAEKILARNAIDRFSGGTVDGALFTESTYYSGTTELVITFEQGRSMTEPEQRILAAVLSDLHHGFLAVGGETSIGRGLFEITAVNGESLSGEENIYQRLSDEMQELWGNQQGVPGNE